MLNVCRDMAMEGVLTKMWTFHCECCLGVMGLMEYKQKPNNWQRAREPDKWFCAECGSFEDGSLVYDIIVPEGCLYVDDGERL